MSFGFFFVSYEAGILINMQTYALKVDDFFFKNIIKGQSFETKQALRRREE